MFGLTCKYLLNHTPLTCVVQTWGAVIGAWISWNHLDLWVCFLFHSLLNDPKLAVEFLNALPETFSSSLRSLFFALLIFSTRFQAGSPDVSTCPLRLEQLRRLLFFDLRGGFHQHLTGEAPCFLISIPEMRRRQHRGGADAGFQVRGFSPARVDGCSLGDLRVIRPRVASSSLRRVAFL